MGVLKTKTVGINCWIPRSHGQTGTERWGVNLVRGLDSLMGDQWHVWTGYFSAMCKHFIMKSPHHPIFPAGHLESSKHVCYLYIQCTFVSILFFPFQNATSKERSSVHCAGCNCHRPKRRTQLASSLILVIIYFCYLPCLWYIWLVLVFMRIWDVYELIYLFFFLIRWTQHPKLQREDDHLQATGAQTQQGALWMLERDHPWVMGVQTVPPPKNPVHTPLWMCAGTSLDIFHWRRREDAADIAVKYPKQVWCCETGLDICLCFSEDKNCI